MRDVYKAACLIQKKETKRRVQKESARVGEGSKSMTRLVLEMGRSARQNEGRRTEALYTMGMHCNKNSGGGGSGS